ncbi:MAG: hypothetical protein K0U74_06750 [Alphaproteobacteria bacterium]|nr:hypothetical protein [Alphaproteobacteria bacterium]
MLDHPLLIVLLVFAGFAIVFPLFWMAIVFLLSRIGGWSSLASRFSVDRDRKVSGDRFGLTSVQFGLFGSYSNCIDVVISRNGLYLRPMVLFRFGHEPLLIPWTEIEDVRSINRWLFTANKVTIKPAQPGGWSQTLTFYGERFGKSLLKNHSRAS